MTGDTNVLEDVFVRDLQAGTTWRVNVSGSGTQANGATRSGASISADGRYIAFESEAGNLVSGDTNSGEDVFVAINPATLTATSLRGSDRYQTAILLSQAAFPAALPAGSGLVLAPGETFPGSALRGASCRRVRRAGASHPGRRSQQRRQWPRSSGSRLRT